MNVMVLSPVRFLGDGSVASFGHRLDIKVIAVVGGLAALRAAGGEEMRSRLDRRDAGDAALGLTEQRQEVIRCRRTGFLGYVARNASADALIKILSDVIEGRVACAAEISAGLLRALFRAGTSADGSHASYALTRRESDVLKLGKAFPTKKSRESFARASPPPAPPTGR